MNIKVGIRTNWKTPVSQYKNLQFFKLIDDGQLRIFVSGYPSDVEKLYCFKWTKFFAYRNLIEEAGLPWTYDAEQLKVSGPTHTVEQSEWLQQLSLKNDMLNVLNAGAIHYVICSDDYVTEVISSGHPEITLEQETQ
jgi:hypothetical protein